MAESNSAPENSPAAGAPEPASPDELESASAAATRLAALKDTILLQWEERVRSAIAAARDGQSTLARDEVAQFLSNLADMMASKVSEQVSVQPAERVEAAPTERDHTPDDGGAASAIAQQVLEFRLLRRTLLESLDVSFSDVKIQDAVIDAVDHAIEDAVLRFVRTQEKARFWSDEQYRALVENTGDLAIFTMDDQGQIVSWNAGAERIFQYTPDEVIGDYVGRLFTREEWHRGEPARELLAATSSDRARDERWMLRKDGRDIWVSGVVFALRDERGVVCGFCKIVRDDTDRRVADQRQRIQQGVTRALSSAADLGEAMPAILSAIALGAEWDCASFWLVDPDGSKMTCAATWTLPDAELAQFIRTSQSLTLRPGEGLPGTVWKEGHWISLHEIGRAENFPRADEARRAAIHSALGFPIVLQGRVLGAMEFFSRASRAWDENLITTVDDVSSQVSQYLERKNAEATLLRSEALKTGILDAAIDAIITMDASSRIVEFNPAAEHMFGYESGYAVGRRLPELIIPPDLRKSHEEGMKRYLLTGQAPILGKRLELTGMRSDGTQFPVELTVTQVKGQGGPFFTGYLRDITDRKKMELELRRRAEELAEADRQKDRFLAMLAHELRTPLAPILNSVSILRLRGSPDPTLARARDVIARQVEHLSALIDDLLNVTRVAHGKIRIHRERLDLVDLVHETAEDHRPALEADGLRLRLQLPDGPLEIDGDRLRLSQVLGNLLTNAGKFTDPGGEVSVSVRSTNEHAVEVSVKDTGSGIDPEMLPHLFESFVQAEQTLARSRGGLGLGLALVKGLVELHGGQVEARSEGVGMGAEFIFTVPLADPTTKSPVSHTAPLAPAASLRVLIIEDNRDAAESLRDLVELFGHEVDIAYSGPSGLDCARRLRPDLVFCDIGLPGMDGYAVAVEIRRDPGLRNLPMIALTGYGGEENQLRAREAGFDLHLTKPVSPDELKAALASVLRSGQTMTVDAALLTSHGETGPATESMPNSLSS